MKRLTLPTQHQFLSYLLVALFYCFTCAGSAYATSASISVNGNEGGVPVTATGNFSSYKHCNNDTPPDCWTVNSGSVRLYQDNHHLGGKSGNGSAQFDTVVDAGIMTQGAHTFKSVATDSEGVSNTSTKTITIDNTPTVTVESPGKVEGAFDISGNATFKEYIGGKEGRVWIYIDGSKRGSKYFEGTSVTWKYSEIVGNMLDAGRYAQGEHTIKAVAYAANGTSVEATATFTIDNTPTVTVESPGKVEGAFDISGNATFKEYIGGKEGRVWIYIDGSKRGSKYFEGTSVTWKYSEIVGNMLDAGRYAQGEHTIKAVAYAANGTSVEATATFTIDNTPTVTVESPGKVEGAFDISGNATFKEYLGGYEGRVDLYIDNSRRARKYFDETSVNWKYSEIVGNMLNAGSYKQGEHTIKAIAYAANGASAEATSTFTIDNTPTVTVESPGKVEGAFDISGNATFKEYLGGYEGRVDLYIDNSRRARKYFDETSVNWKYSEIVGYMLDAGGYKQGEHTIKAIAYAANGASVEATSTFTIDNTPTVTVESPGKVEGAFDISGNATFKEYLGGNEGRVDLYIDNSRRARKYFDETSVTWKYSEIVGNMLNAGSYKQGEHTIKAIAYAANGTSVEATSTFTIDNTPTPIILGSEGCPDETIDILGTTTFKENISGNEGKIALYIRDDGASSFTKHGKTKSYEGKKIIWKYSDFTGARMKKSVWGQREILVKIVVTAANGASASAVKGMVIPALGCPTTFGN